MKWIGTQTVYDSVRFSKRVTFKGSQLIIFEGGLTSNDSIVIGKAVNDGNPFISLGSSLSERLEIKAEYESGAQGLDTVRFTSFTAGTGSDDGRFVFEVDDSFLFAILDDGIKIKASGNLEIGTGNAVLSDSSGTTTLSNIDALDATTIATFETAMEANLDTFGSQMTSASALATVGTIGTGVWNADVIASAYLDTDTAHLTTNQTFTGVKTFTKPILGINAVFYGDIGVTPRDGAKIHVDGATITDTATSASGTADLNTTVSIEAHELVAVNSGVTTTNAATLYIKGAPIAGTNMTLTNAYALWVNSGLVKFDGTLTVDGTITGDVTGDLTGDASGSSGSCTGQAATVATIAGLAPNTATTQASQPNITTLAGVTSIGAPNMAIGSAAVDQYKAVNNGNPTYSIGSSDTNELIMQALYHSGAQTLETVIFRTETASGTADDGKFLFQVDEFSTLQIDDGGIDFVANHGISIAGTDILTDSSGTATLSNIDALDATTKATINSKSRAYFDFKGYGTADGTNYELPEAMSENKAPFEHDTSTGSDGLTAQTTVVIIRSGGIVMPYTGVLKKFTGWVASAGTGTVDVGIFKVTPVDNNAGNLTPVLLVNEQVTAAGGTKMRSFSETSSFDAGFTAGDIIYSAVLGGTSAKTWYLNSMLEVEWS